MKDKHIAQMWLREKELGAVADATKGEGDVYKRQGVKRRRSQVLVNA